MGMIAEVLKRHEGAIEGCNSVKLIRDVRSFGKFKLCALNLDSFVWCSLFLDIKSYLTSET